MRNSIHVPQVHVLMPLTARTVQPNFGSGLCSCSRVPKPAQPTNSKAKRRSAQAHGSGVADLRRRGPAPAYLRALVCKARCTRSQPTHCKPPPPPKALHPARPPYVATHRTTPHLQQNLDLEASVCRMGGTDFCTLPYPTLPLIMLTAPIQP